MGNEVKYKVVYKAYGHWTEQKFSDLELAYECAVRTNGIVPFELVAKQNGVQWGAVFEGKGEATMVAKDGEFEFVLPNGRKIKIDTK